MAKTKKKGKLTKKQRAAIARRNLKKAWAARRKMGRKGKKKSKKCPKVRGRGRVSKRAAKLCLARRKRGRPSKADRAVYRKAIKALGGKKAAKKYLAAMRRRRTGR